MTTVYRLVEVNQQRGINMKKIMGYTVLSDGTVLKKNGKPFKWCDNGKGYLISAFSVKGKRVPVSQHIVVAEAFYGKCPKGYEVGHKDDNRKNNHPDNLEYVTKSENNKQSWDRGNRSATGSMNANSKISEEDVCTICKIFSDSSTKPNLSKLSRETGFARHTLSAIYNRKQWTHISKQYIY